MKTCCDHLNYFTEASQVRSQHMMVILWYKPSWKSLTHKYISTFGSAEEPTLLLCKYSALNSKYPQKFLMYISLKKCLGRKENCILGTNCGQLVTTYSDLQPILTVFGNFAERGLSRLGSIYKIQHLLEQIKLHLLPYNKK